MPDLDWAISSINRRQPTLNRWLTFYRGHHPRMFNTRRFDRSFRAVVDGARVNMCGRVVRSFTDLIVHEGWTDSNAADTPEATRLWAESRMDLHLPRLVREAAIYGDGFLSVWPDPDGVPRFALENPRGIAIRTAPEDPTRIDVAVKMWRDVERGLVRVTEYRRDVIFRWAAPSKDGTISKASSLRPLRSTDVPEGADASPETTNPYDVVPVFHIPHAVVDPPYGESVLRDVVPVQLLLNKEVGDLTIASEAATIPSRVFIGSEPDGRDTDAPKPGAVTWLPNPDARVVELAGPSIGPLRGVVDAFAADIGRVSDTPVHEIATTGDWPSGEALKTATARQMNAARELKKTLLRGSPGRDRAPETARQAAGPAHEFRPQGVDERAKDARTRLRYGRIGGHCDLRRSHMVGPSRRLAAGVRECGKALLFRYQRFRHGPDRGARHRAGG